MATEKKETGKKKKMKWRQELDGKDLEEFPLFMTKMPDNPDANEALAAISALKYEGMDAAQITEVLKNEGNELFKMGPKHYQEAKDRYAEALAHDCGDARLCAVIYANRAAVNLKLENYGSVVDDCKRGQALDPTNVKTGFRGAQACLKLERADEGVAFCEKALEVANEDEAKDLRPLHEKLLAMQTKQREKAAAQKRKAEDAGKAAATLHETIRAHGVVLGKPLFEVMDPYKERGHVVMDPESGELIWPVIFLYPEHQQTDFIQAFSENDTFADHLAGMFDPAGPPAEWDLEGKYKAGNLVVYMTTNLVKPLKAYEDMISEDAKTRYLHEVDPRETLGEALRYPGYVVPHFPAFQIFVKGSQSLKDFRKQEAA